MVVNIFLKGTLSTQRISFCLLSNVICKQCCKPHHTHLMNAGDVVITLLGIPSLESVTITRCHVDNLLPLLIALKVYYFDLHHPRSYVLTNGLCL